VLIVTNLSVFGILTVLPFMEITRNVPNPDKTTFSPFAKTRPSSSKNTSTASSAPFFVRCAFLATCSTSSFFVILRCFENNKVLPKSQAQKLILQQLYP